MTTLILSNELGLIAEYKTDLLKGNDGNFTILQQRDITTGAIQLTDEQKAAGWDFMFKGLPYHDNLSDMKEFAETKNLKLTRVDIDGEETVWDYTEGSSSTSESTSE
jgi:hypothetical protein